MDNYKTVLEMKNKMQFAGEMIDFMYQHNQTILNRLVSVSFNDDSRKECAVLLMQTLLNVIDAIVENNPCSNEKNNSGTVGFSDVVG